MQSNTPKDPENVAPASQPTDWAELRARAAKLGISLSELQRQEREKKMRLARKNQSSSGTNKS